ncbi:MAG TPA: FAD-dependent oxidoreductase, partial [Thauera aminoaromatica]|nr:FAD-dependent oxidoreductase [Thauera aminoaromatica]
MKKPLLLLLVLALVAGFFASGLHRQLDLDTLKAGMAGFAAWREASPVLVAALYFAAYVAVTALSLPGAAVMTLAGGALFGLGWGLLIVSFASTIGATLAFLVSRHLLRDSVHARFGARLRAIDEGIARDGAFYLFSLRLVPAFPFFLINLLMGLTPIRTRTFYWVSQLGMLPGTLVYVNAGTELGAVDSLAGVLSPGLVASFVLLGLFPLLARWMVERVQARRVYAGWQRPARFERNLVVIGAGAAGLVTSYIAAAVKAKVTLVEAGRMGGDCLNTGCVPSKALIRSARLAHQIRHADRYGLEPGEPEIDFRRLMARVRAVIRKIEPHDSVERYSALGVEVLQGRARIVDPWTVEVALNEGGTRRLSTRSIVIATGARPTVPDLPGLEAVGYLTSDTVWDAFAALDAPPRRLLVLGGGPIGCELAQACARLGS